MLKMSRWFTKAPWDDVDFSGGGGPASSADAPSEFDTSFAEDHDRDDLRGAEAGDELADFLLELHYAGRMSAKTLCIIAWFATHAGAQGSIDKLALKPSSSSGHFQRKVDRSQGVNLRDHRFYLINTAGRRKWDVSRAVYQTPMRLPHEVIESELQSDLGISKQLDPSLEKGSLLPATKCRGLEQPYCSVTSCSVLGGVQAQRRSSFLLYLFIMF